MGIQTPYKNDDLYDLLKNGTEWETGDTQYNDVKSDIKDYLKRINQKKCFFCQNKINTANNAGTIEHILDKKTYSMYMYKPENLTYSCGICNSLKRNINVLSQQELERKKIYNYDNYPLNSNDYIIIHPYLDDYCDYIEIDDIFYISKNNNPKGNNTINFYHLTRLELAENKIKLDRETFTNAFLIDLLEGIDINIDDILDYVFKNKVTNVSDIYISDTPLRFIDNYLNPNKQSNIKLLNSITSITNDKVEVFKEYRILVDSINDSEHYDYNNILSSKLYKLHDENIIFTNVGIVLTSLYTLLKSHARIKEISKITLNDMTALYIKFNKYLKDSDKNMQLSLIEKLNNLLKCLQYYNSEWYTLDIKEKIKEDIAILKLIKQQLKLIRKLAK